MKFSNKDINQPLTTLRTKKKQSMWIVDSSTRNITPYKLYKLSSEPLSRKGDDLQGMYTKRWNDNQKNQLKNPVNITSYSINKPIKVNKIRSRNDRDDLFLEGGQMIAKIRSKFSSAQQFIKNQRNRKNQKNTQENWQSQNLNAYESNQLCNQKKSTPKLRVITHCTNPQRQRSHQQQQCEKIALNQEISNKSLISGGNKKYLVKQDNSINLYDPSQNYSQKNKVTSLKTKYNRKKSIRIKKFTQQNDTNHIKNISSRPLYYLKANQFNRIKAEGFIVVQYPARQVIFGNYYRKSFEIASLTKIMTFYTILQLITQHNKNIMEEWIEIDEDCQAMTGTSADIMFGDIYTIQQLLYGLMLPSGNDAAMALAKWGGELILQTKKNSLDLRGKNKNSFNKCNQFVKQMNVNCRKLNMKSSKFGNPHGLPDHNSGSTAEDMAILVCECMNNELFRTVIACKKYICTVIHINHKEQASDNQSQKITSMAKKYSEIKIQCSSKHQVVWQNTNKLLRRPNFIGGKTGVTATAGPCLATCYQMPEQQQKLLIVILLRTTKLSRRFKETRFLISLALNKLGSANSNNGQKQRNKYWKQINQTQRNDIQLDSDNSEDEQQFCFERNDAYEMLKRNKILTFEM